MTRNRGIVVDGEGHGGDDHGWIDDVDGTWPHLAGDSGRRPARSALDIDAVDAALDALRRIGSRLAPHAPARHPRTGTRVLAALTHPAVQRAVIELMVDSLPKARILNLLRELVQTSADDAVAAHRPTDPAPAIELPAMVRARALATLGLLHRAARAGQRDEQVAAAIAA
jgi:hypothetical protein